MQGIIDNIYILIGLGMGGAFFMSISFILLHIKGQNKLLKEQQQAQQAQLNHQKELLGAVIRSQEAERKRIGQDLHDDVGSALSSLRFTLDMYQPVVNEQDRYALFNKECKQLIDQVITDVRNISHNLSPTVLNLYGLEAALEKQIGYINRAKHIKAIIQNHVGGLIDELDISTATALYRVLEELLNNTVKHAGADCIDISFEMEEGNLLIQYHDNGKGLPDAARAGKGTGMQNIESRLTTINATYHIAPPAHQGFTFTINYPLQHKLENA